VRGPWAYGGPEGALEWSLGGPRKFPRKEAARERAVKAKVGAVLFRKRKKIRKKNQSKGVLRVIGGPGRH
jgi:hypothetical protein